jgi:hypothetical protein
MLNMGKIVLPLARGTVVRVGQRFEMGEAFGCGRMVNDAYTGQVFTVIRHARSDDNYALVRGIVSAEQLDACDYDVWISACRLEVLS